MISANWSFNELAERIYTTTYYIPSSPTEVRAYTPILPRILISSEELDMSHGKYAAHGYLRKQEAE